MYGPLSRVDHFCPKRLKKALHLHDTNRLLLLTCFLAALSAHKSEMNYIYKGTAVVESKFHFEIKD